MTNKWFVTRFMTIAILMMAHFSDHFPQYADSIDSTDIALELKTGDKIPDIEFRMLNYTADNACIADFKGRWVFLYLWSVPCGRAAILFYRLDILQKRFGDSISIILLNSQQAKDQEHYFLSVATNWIHRLDNFQLPFAREDSTAWFIVDPKSFPQCVIIDPQGKLYALTSATELTEDNISIILHRGKNNHVKKNIVCKMMMNKKKKPF